MRSLMPTLALGSALAILIPGGSATPQAKDRAIGTWKLNLAKSKYDPGPPPQSLTVRYEESGLGVRVTTEGVDAQGNPTHTEYTANYDGKDSPARGSPDYSSVALKRLDVSTVKVTRKKDGKVVQTVTRVVSKDGKRLTTTTRGTDAKGRRVHNIAVFDRQ